jgi:hypothetical protein
MARAFNGSSQYISTGGLLQAMPASFAFWLKPTAIASNPGWWNLSDGVSAHAYNFINTAINNNPIIVDNGGSAQETSASALATGSYSLIVLSFVSASNRSMYHNNAKVTDTNAGGGAIYAGTNRGGLGALNLASVSNYYNGLIAYYGVWAGTLTDANAAELWAGRSPRRVRSDILRGFYSLVGDAYLNSYVNPSSQALSNNGSTDSGDNPRIYH